MKIITKKQTEMPFDSVMPGNCFEYKGQYYLAIDDPFLAIDLETGIQIKFLTSEKVNVVDAHVVIDNAEG